MAIEQKGPALRCSAKDRANDQRRSFPRFSWQQTDRSATGFHGERQRVARVTSRALDFDKINRAAVAALPAVLARILPAGKAIGREFVALNPTRADRRLGSFKIRLSGARAGAWSDFATGDRGSDPVSLVAYLEGVPQPEAARLLGRMLSIDCRVR